MINLFNLCLRSLLFAKKEFFLRQQKNFKINFEVPLLENTLTETANVTKIHIKSIRFKKVL